MDNENDPFLKFFMHQNICYLDESLLVLFADDFSKNKLRDYEAATSSLIIPLTFTSPSEEMNFISLIDLLSVACNFEKDCSALNQNSLREVLIFGMISMILSSKQLDSNMMVSMCERDIAEIFGIPTLSADLAASSLGIHVESRSKLMDYAEILNRTLVLSGRALIRKGYKDLSSMLQDLLSESRHIEDLCRIISSDLVSLDDRHFVTIQHAENTEKDEVLELCFFNNVKRMIYDVLPIVQKATNPSLHIPGLDQCSGALTSRAISSLFQLGILQLKSRRQQSEGCSAEGNDPQQFGADILSLNTLGIGDVVSIRTAAVVACDRLCEAINSKLDASVASSIESGNNDVGVTAQSATAKAHVTPMKLSLYLESVCRTDMPCFWPSEGAEKW